MKTISLQTLAAIVLMCVISNAHAVYSTYIETVDTEPKFHYTVYVSQGFIHSTDNVVHKDSNEGMLNLGRTEIGAYASYSLSNNVDLRAGLKYDHSGTNIPRFRTVFAVIDAKTSHKADVFGIRLGKVRNHFGFENSIRENPAIRNMDFAPQSIYRDGFKTLLTSDIGAQAYTELNTEKFGTFYLEATVAKPSIDREATTSFFLREVDGKFESDSRSFRSANIQWKSPDYKWSVFLETTDLQLMYKDPIVQSPLNGSMNTRVTLLGARRYFSNFDVSATVMLSKPRGVVWDLLTNYPNMPRTRPLAFNIDARYYSGNFVYSVGYNEYYSDFNDRDGSKLSAISGMPGHRFYSKDFNIGVRYTMKEWVFKAELHNVRGTSVLSSIENKSFKPTYRFVSMSVVYVF